VKKYLAILTALLVPVLVQAAPNCEKNPIYCKILTLNPKVDKAFALELSNSIYRYSKKYGTNPALSVAIAMQESAFANVNRTGSVLTKAGKIIHGDTDIGVFQLHVNTIEYMGIDLERLRTDVDYQTYWHIRILKSKISTCKAKREQLQVQEGNEWSCYHSFTFKKRRIYLEDVNVHLTKIQL